MCTQSIPNLLLPNNQRLSHIIRKIAFCSTMALWLATGYNSHALAAKERLGTVLQQRKKRFLPCYERALKQTPKLEGRMAIGFTIATDGSVGKSRILWSQLAHAGLHQCILRELSTWRFARRAKVLDVSYPLHLTPGPAPAKRQPKLGRLKKAQIQRVVRNHMIDIRRCYESALRTNPTLKGKVVLGFVISTQGKVSSARISRSSLKHKQTQGCLIKVAMGWRFPKPKGKGIVKVSYPFTFTQ